jgi:hypothetical protein
VPAAPARGRDARLKPRAPLREWNARL